VEKFFGPGGYSGNSLQGDDLGLERRGIRPDRSCRIIEMAIALPAHCAAARPRSRKHKAALSARGFAAGVDFTGFPAVRAGVSVGDAFDIGSANGAGTGSNDRKEGVESCVEHVRSEGAILVRFHNGEELRKNWGEEGEDYS